MYSLSQIFYPNNDVGFLLTLNKKYYPKVKKNLEEKGFFHFFEWTEISLFDINSKDISGYGEEYFNWQKNIGKFGGWANQSKFLPFLKEENTVIDFGCGGVFTI